MLNKKENDKISIDKTLLFYQLELLAECIPHIQVSKIEGHNELNAKLKHLIHLWLKESNKD